MGTLLKRSTTALALSAAAVSTALVALSWYLRRGRRRSKPFPPARQPEDVLRRGLRKQDLPDEADAVVIGAGPAGLALAVMLGRLGRRVLVLEQHDRAGGLHSFQEQGYDFETGFHYAGEMRKGQELRTIVDSLTNDELEFANLETGPERIYDKVVFSDGDKFGVPSGIKNWLNALQEKFPEEKDAIDVYAKDLKATQTSFFPMMIWRSIPSEWLKSKLYNLLAAPNLHLCMLAGKKMEELTQNERLKAILGYISLGCIGVTLEKMDYRSMLGLHLHFGEGAYFPVGGPSKMASAMVKQIERQEGRVFVRARVNCVLFDKDGRATGVQLAKDGLTVRAPVVVSTIGLHGTEKFLQDQPCHEEFVQRLEPLKRTHGHLFLFVGIRGSAEELNLPRHNTWMLPGEDLPKCMEEFQRDRDADAPFGYVGMAFPSSKDPSYKDFYPDQSTCAIVAGDIPWEWFEKWNGTRVHHRGQDYEDLKKKYELRLMDMLYSQFPQVRGRVQYVSLGTPLDTNLFLGKTQGESYGLQQTLAKTWADTNWLFAKPIIQRWPDGFFLAGQDVTSDGFAPSVVSAILAACAIDGFLPAWLQIVSMLGLWGTLKALLS